MVVVPVYNRIIYLAPAIDSVARQSFENWELAVVDDGSDEDVRGLVEQYKDRRVRYIRQSNQGNAAARNRGIACSDSEYVACLDSDDVWEPEFLQTCVRHLDAERDIDVAHTQVHHIDEQGQLLPLRVGPAPHDGDLLEKLLLGYPILPSSALARRSCFERWGMYTPGLDDWELWLRWAAQGCRFSCIERPLLRYRLHNQNYALAYDRRRAVHFAMLDEFYDQEGLPEAAIRLREYAYANQHLRFAVLAWQVGQRHSGTADFITAILRHPEFLADRSVYTQIACAHQGRLLAGTPQNLSLQLAEDSVTQCLICLFDRSTPTKSIATRRCEAYGWAYLALAQLAYGVAHDMRQARRWLWRAARHYPSLVVRSDWAAWLLRSVIGRRYIRWAKGILSSLVHYAES
ncbi:MAG: glycosyltransferase family 2 protein [Chloroflexi bacterium]|nr:glycosyltransferase family 2 protein [Chloroflexota bacterium]